MNRSHILVASAALAACLAAPAAQAQSVETVKFQNAAGFCQAALPAYEGNVRKRPTAVANEGTGNAFVSCSMSSLPDEAGGPAEVTLVIFNRTAEATDITCSLVNSFQAGGTVTPMTMSVPASDRAFFTWTAVDLEVPQIDFANFSCNLKPGTDIGYGYFYYSYEFEA